VKGGRQPVPNAVLGRRRDPIDRSNTAGGGAPETSQNGRGRELQGEHDWGSAMANQPPPQRWAGESPPAPMPLDKNGGQPPGLLCRGARVKTQAENVTGECGVANK